MAADGLAPVSVRTSADTVMTMFGSHELYSATSLQHGLYNTIRIERVKTTSMEKESTMVLGKNKALFDM